MPSLDVLHVSDIFIGVGVRGCTMTVWTDISGGSISDLRNSYKYPYQPDIYHNLDQFFSPTY